MIDKKNYSLLAHNTFGIDVRCRRFVEYGSVEEAQELVRTLTPEDGPLLILGGGSNLLLTGACAADQDRSGTPSWRGVSPMATTVRRISR